MNYRSLGARLDCVDRTPKLDATVFLHLHNLLGWNGSAANRKMEGTLESACRPPTYPPSYCESKRPGPPFAGAVGIRASGSEP